MVRSDLEQYIRRANDWAPVEAETARAIDRILRTQFVDESEVRRQIEADRPRASAHLHRLMAATPSSEPIRAIHQRYLTTWHDLLDGYDAILSGFDSGDASYLSAGREALQSWRQGILATAQELRRLRQELG